MVIKRPNQLLKNAKNPKKKNFRYIIFGAASLFVIATVLFFLYVFEGLVSLEELENPKAQLASNVYSTDGELIGQFYKENRVEVSIDTIPPHVINALIATEDKNFYDHWGVDLQRFVKAMIKNVLLFRREGASTITMQLAKNLYGFKAKHESKAGTVIRKIREWITAVQIEKTYTKREILEMYFNISYFGRSAYGISMASRIYFDKDVKDLTVPDAGILVSLLKSPGGYDPFNKYENAFRRRNIVMQNMVNDDYLSEETYERLKLERIKLSYKKVQEKIYGSIAPHFLEYIRQQMEKLSDKYGFDLYQGGLRIYTTLDSRMQKIANHAAQLHLDRFQKQFDASWNWNRYSSILREVLDKAIKNRPEYKSATSQRERLAFYNRIVKDKTFIDSVKNEEKKIEVGFVALDTRTGEIRAMVGGRDNKFMYGLNHATQIRRQPGSAFKPFVYTVAIDRGLYPAFPILNQPFAFNDGSAKLWSPANFDHSSGGYTTLRWGLAESYNLVAARLIIEDFAPLPDIGRFAARMGIKTRLDLTPAISLGSSVVTPLEIVSGYATLGNRGVYNEPISILQIEDKDGVVIEKFNTQANEAISEETAYIVTDMMRTVMDGGGTGTSARSVYNFQRPAAGKTGTNTNYADAWFIGFTPQITAGVWVGFDDQRVTFTGTYGQGAIAALPIWAIFMHDIYEQINMPVEDFQTPPSGKIIQAAFCRESIYENGRPRLVSPDCRTGTVTDIINVKDLPPVYDPNDEFEPRFNAFPYNDTSGIKRKD
ncbi:MAG: penicillin-binding protein [Stygiobacter sp. RIFOXYA12_FULL_38_9]|nr:MAG: penicillin-binding protein [Stygiobacter sp. RIFOXYA12_FULL_38_9]OGV08311.1 MAG: penicillin-binding protein [Stygiobacter sp. RIFOXYB2_FULL_37_11]OGV12138.1 MAG: penicillin-binding protein [Stygiobacter sp. RIFOXYC2_FULL_38_25]OGV12185.1 MAG: penicillin-binding protein [Stygiobacter sp. RIFOXYA2_FULL_38_8]OGV81264.1 MAG: penicillin-binding protein [Stygiobacter sp. GWF2_38_21]RJQ61526.1 MAG: PBP1A family penicillin-binding protein [Stygiobacter sp.]